MADTLSIPKLYNNLFKSFLSKRTLIKDMILCLTAPLFFLITGKHLMFLFNFGLDIVLRHSRHLWLVKQASDLNTAKFMQHL